MTPHFSDKEIACKHCGALPDHGEFQDFMQHLERLRVSLGFPFIITSGFRCENHPIEQRKVKHIIGRRISPHFHGAVDILANRGQAAAIVTFAIMQGFKGVGLRQHGPDNGRMVHLDRILRTEDGGPIIWTYQADEGPHELPPAPQRIFPSA